MARKTIEAAQPSTEPDPLDRPQHPLAVLEHVSNTDKHREAAVGHRVIYSPIVWSTAWDRKQPWVARFRTRNPTVDSVELVLAEVPTVLGDHGGALAQFVLELELPDGQRGQLYGKLDEVARYVRQLVAELVATTNPSSGQVQAS